MAELAAVERSLADAMRKGTPPQALALDPLIERHRAWVSSAWSRTCRPEAYAGLAEVYGHPDFQVRYEAIEDGFSAYLPGSDAGLGAPAGSTRRSAMMGKIAPRRLAGQCKHLTGKDDQ